MNVPIYLPTRVNVIYEYNEEKNRFNYPWENKIEIKDYVNLEDANLTIRISDESFLGIVKEIINFYINCKFTSGIEIGPNHIDVVIQDAFLDMKDQFGGIIRGCVETPFPNAKVKVSIAGCERTKERDEPEFLQKHKELSGHRWTLKGMMVYVIAHEIGHLFSPKPLQEPNNYLGEIIAILYGSKFAFDKDYIYVPQGRFLKDDWKKLGIKLNSKDFSEIRNQKLRKCEEKIRECLIN